MVTSDDETAGRPDADQVARVRGFSRAVTARVGVLQDRYLGRGRPAAESRLLWEIGSGGGDVRALRARLGLDSGYLSRLLRSLAADGLVRLDPRPGDRRARTARLTSAGRTELAALDAGSDALAGSLLRPLNPGQRERLVAAMAEVERLLTAGTVVLEDTDPDHPDARRCLLAYYAELEERFDTGYDPARSLLPDADALRPPRGRFLVARLYGEPVGCAGLKLPPGVPAEVKRMWVAPQVRGLGLARRLLAELEDRAARAGRDLLRLDSHSALEAALGLYRSQGYREVEPFNDELYAHHWFEKRLAAAPGERAEAREDPGGAEGPER
jgi:DNA-binding MarR family transcriptional regulator